MYMYEYVIVLHMYVNTSQRFFILYSMYSLEKLENVSRFYLIITTPTMRRAISSVMALEGSNVGDGW